MPGTPRAGSRLRSSAPTRRATRCHSPPSGSRTRWCSWDDRIPRTRLRRARSCPSPSCGPPGDDRPMTARRFAVALAVIAVAALGVRIAFVQAEGPRALKTGDAYFYYSVTRQLADGDGYVRPYELAAHPPRRVETAEHPPL